MSRMQHQSTKAKGEWSIASGIACKIGDGGKDNRGAGG